MQLFWHWSEASREATVFHLGGSAATAWCFNDAATVLSRRVGGGQIAPRNTNNYIYIFGGTKAVPFTCLCESVLEYGLLTLWLDFY